MCTHVTVGLSSVTWHHILGVRVGTEFVFSALSLYGHVNIKSGTLSPDLPESTPLLYFVLYHGFILCIYIVFNILCIL